GETVIVFLKLVFSQIGNDVFDVLVFDRSRSELLLRSDFPAPAEPHASVVLQRRTQRHLKPAGARRAIPGGNRNTIGYDHQARQYRPPTSQLGRRHQLSGRSGKRIRIAIPVLGANSIAFCPVREVAEPSTSSATSRPHDVCRSRHIMCLPPKCSMQPPW